MRYIVSQTVASSRNRPSPLGTDNALPEGRGLTRLRQLESACFKHTVLLLGINGIWSLLTDQRSQLSLVEDTLPVQPESWPASPCLQHKPRY